MTKCKNIMLDVQNLMTEIACHPKFQIGGSFESDYHDGIVEFSGYFTVNDGSDKEIDQELGGSPDSGDRNTQNQINES